MLERDNSLFHENYSTALHVQSSISTYNHEFSKVEQIGEGGQGKIYLASNPKLIIKEFDSFSEYNYEH